MEAAIIIGIGVLAVVAIGFQFRGKMKPKEGSSSGCGCSGCTCATKQCPDGLQSPSVGIRPGDLDINQNSRPFRSNDRHHEG
ncbi:MAG: hypothetical protein U1D96_02650 [Eubacteriales bacterium]|nr:hypothetical protein [Bacillota bacterium]MBV1726478.1 hypothetical protein [Desulforudis sp.]MDZ4042378.1 hypothetical protein [Eubacteriales bacterium]MBU4554267.1 hypothetical protein [Bacillota bacterium]MBV1735164.1 hypothetical protein [Desulforudis sp.]